MNTHLLLLLSMGASRGPTLARCAGAQELVSLGAQDRGWKDPALPISGPPAQAPLVSPGVKRAGDTGLVLAIFSVVWSTCEKGGLFTGWHSPL